jgi:NADH:ubiquinone oxidoreductase subunit 2 (subunit N)
MDLGNLASLRYFGPELLLAAGALLIILIDLVIKDKSRIGDIALIFTAGALLLIGLEPHTSGAWLFHRMIVVDSFAVFFRALIALAGVVAVWMPGGRILYRSAGEHFGHVPDGGFSQLADGLLVA